MTWLEHEARATTDKEQKHRSIYKTIYSNGVIKFKLPIIGRVIASNHRCEFTRTNEPMNLAEQ